jgi:hypothetical protein
MKSMADLNMPLPLHDCKVINNEMQRKWSVAVVLGDFVKTMFVAYNLSPIGVLLS